MIDPVPVAEFAPALELGPREHVALVGGGGKTTTLFALASAARGTAIATTTTRMAAGVIGELPLVVGGTDDGIAAELDRAGRVLVWDSIVGKKAVGVTPERCDRWFIGGVADLVLVEADGARRRPFTAPHVFEPVIPATATLVIGCIGADALGRVIADQCHRPMRIAAVAGCSPYQRFTPERAAAVLCSDRGTAKQVPAGARYVVAVHGVDDASAGLAADLVDALAERSIPVVPVARIG